MKKYFKYVLLIVLLFQVNLVKAKPANESFDDDNFYKCVVDAYNSGKQDDEKKQYTDSLSDLELESITELNCQKFSTTPDEEKITSTKGLEKLINLESLILDENKLSNIDLSKNVKLTNLEMRKNNLVELNIDNNLELKKLVVYRNNLKEINVGNNEKLTVINVNNNEISTINVSNNKLLTALDVSSNNLTSVDVKNNLELTWLDISYNDISQIDLTKNTKLEYLEIWETLCKEIDVSKNTELYYLRIIANNVEGKLEKIDVTNNKKLLYLHLEGNVLKELDLRNNNLLKRLRISMNNFLSLDISNLSDLNVSQSWFQSQKRKIIVKSKDGLYTLNLKDYDKNIDMSKIKNLVLPDNAQYDEDTGLITFESVVADNNVITYDYKLLDDLDMDVTITLIDGGEEVEPPKEEVKPEVKPEDKTQENKPQEVPEDADKPLPSSPQTGGYLVGNLVLVGLVTGLYYKYYLARKNKINKI